MTSPLIDFGNGLRLDLSTDPWRTQGCRFTFAANSGAGKSHLVAVAIEVRQRPLFEMDLQPPTAETLTVRVAGGLGGAAYDEGD